MIETTFDTKGVRKRGELIGWQTAINLQNHQMRIHFTTVHGWRMVGVYQTCRPTWWQGKSMTWTAWWMCWSCTAYINKHRRSTRPSASYRWESGHRWERIHRQMLNSRCTSLWQSSFCWSEARRWKCKRHRFIICVQHMESLIKKSTYYMTKLLPKSPMTHTTKYNTIDMYRPRLLGPAEGQSM